MTDVPIDREWTVTDYLLAEILDELRFENDLKRIGESKRPKVQRPDRIVHTYGADPVPIEKMNEVLGWQQMAQHLGSCNGCTAKATDPSRH